MQHYGLGQPLRRREDRRFLTGQGRYLDDLDVPRLAHLQILRSEHAHARILGIDVSAAKEIPGVLAVLTGADWRASGHGPIPTRTPVKNSDGSPISKPERPALCLDRVRYVGDPVAVIVAESVAAASEAAAQVLVDYEPLPAVTSARQALAPGAQKVWDQFPDNVCVDFQLGDEAAVTAAFASAAHVVSLDVDNQRVMASPLETRGAIGHFDATSGEYFLQCSSQNVHSNRNQLADEVFHVGRDTIRLKAPDIGGGFGAKNPLYPEQALVLWAARRAGRPVKWVDTRSDSFLADVHGRDQQSRVELALDEHGGILALRVSSIASIGAYLASIGPFTPTGGTARTQGGPYRIPALLFRSKALFTHSSPTDPYRGAGRPEASYQIERIIDVAARRLGMDPGELRLRNLLTPEQLPHVTGSGAEIECGNFPELLRRCQRQADWLGFARRREQSAARGQLRGIGICSYLECSGGGPREFASLEFIPKGRVRLSVGCHSTGMGHETVLPQIVAATLGIAIERIDYVQADTSATPFGGGHGGSRNLEMGGSASLLVSERVIEKARDLAALSLEAAREDIRFSNGQFEITGTDRSISMSTLIDQISDPAPPAAMAQANLDTSVEHDRDGITFPNGCHIVEVEVDPQTGVVQILAYHVVDDFGTIINPLTAAGQVMGGVAQGIGQALLEKIIYQEDSGQLLTGSFMDYGIPKADNLPPIQVEFFEEAPSRRNPLGVKGSGEAGCCGALAATVNAVMDALSGQGIEHLDMPLTPLRVWQALSDRN